MWKLSSSFKASSAACMNALIRTPFRSVTERLLVRRTQISYKMSETRYFSSSTAHFSKPTTKIYNLSPPGQAVTNYRQKVLREYQFLKTLSPKNDTNTYSQLPDDSQFIEQHYLELKLFKAHIGKEFASFSSEELLEKLYEYINEAIEEQNLVTKGVSENIDDIFVKIKGQEISLERFIRLLLDVKITLNLNSNHTFILDTLLENKEKFDEIDKKISGGNLS